MKLASFKKSQNTTKANGCGFYNYITRGWNRLSSRDVNARGLKKPLLDRSIPGGRRSHQKIWTDRIPYACLSRQCCRGTIKKYLVTRFTSSTNGAKESRMVFPSIYMFLEFFKRCKATINMGQQRTTY